MRNPLTVNAANSDDEDEDKDKQSTSQISKIDATQDNIIANKKLDVIDDLEQILDM